MILREATLADLGAYFEHCQRHFRESGEGGDVIFHPITDFSKHNREDEIAKLAEALQAPLDRPGWQRLWIAIEDDGRVLADCLIRSSFMDTTQHRCQYAIGVERSARGLGLGRRLSEMAIAWARQQARFSWLDLWVFAHNPTAIALYKSLGFETVDVVRDQFRVNGQKIDDIHMTLRLDEIL